MAIEGDSNTTRTPDRRPPRGGKLLLGLCLLVILTKNPTILIHVFPTVHKVLYSLAVLIVLLDFLKLSANGHRVPAFKHLSGVKAYTVFLYLSVLIMLIDGLASSSIDMVKSVQFVMNIAQFYVILYLLMRLGRPADFLDAAYKTAIGLAVLALCMVMCNYTGRFPFPGVAISSEVGNIYYYFPFGFAGYMLPMNPVFYRSISYFSEPALYAFFTFPFVFYALYRFQTTRQCIHLLWFAVLLAAGMSTQSVAGVSVLWMSLTMICLLKWLQNRRNVKLLLVASVLLIAGLAGMRTLKAVGGSWGDSATVLQRRYLSVEDRSLQWSVGWAYVKGHFLGKGIGISEKEAEYRATAKDVAMYTVFTNILEYAYYLGLVYLPILIFLLVTVGTHVLRGMWSPSAQTQVLTAMLLYMLLYNVSVSVFFTGYFLMMLSIFLLIRWQEPQLAPDGKRGALRLRTA